MEVVYVTYPGEKPWCSDFTAWHLAAHSKNRVIQASLKGVYDFSGGIIHIHNVQILEHHKWGAKQIKELQSRGNRVLGGLRGEMGKGRYDDLLRAVDAVSVGVDPSLKAYAEKLNPRVYVLPPGEDPNVFTPLGLPKRAVVSWAGRDHKKYKNADLLDRLGYSYIKATYDKYIPHLNLPAFYNATSVCVNFSDHEGFWRPAIEAAMCELAIVSTDVGVVREILEPEFIIPTPARNHIDDYRRLIGDIVKGEYPGLGQRNRERALKYSWDKVAQIYDRAWGELY